MELRQRLRCVDHEVVAQQFAIVYHVGDLLRSFGEAYQMGRVIMDKAESFGESDWDKYIIAESQVDALMNMRKDFMRFTEVCASIPALADVLSNSTDSSFDFFVGLIKFDFNDLKKEVIFFQDAVRDVWSVALSKQSCTVEAASVPGWSTKVDDILSDKTICESLVLNPKYGVLHSTNELLMKNIKMVTKVQKDHWQCMVCIV